MVILIFMYLRVTQKSVSSCKWFVALVTFIWPKTCMTTQMNIQMARLWKKFLAVNALIWSLPFSSTVDGKSWRSLFENFCRKKTDLISRWIFSWRFLEVTEANDLWQTPQTTDSLEELIIELSRFGWLLTKIYIWFWTHLCPVLSGAIGPVVHHKNWRNP